jgi:hypothetical protein
MRSGTPGGQQRAAAAAIASSDADAGGAGGGDGGVSGPQLLCLCAECEWRAGGGGDSVTADGPRQVAALLVMWLPLRVRPRLFATVPLCHRLLLWCPQNSLDVSLSVSVGGVQAGGQQGLGCEAGRAATGDTRVVVVLRLLFGAPVK